MKVLLVAVLALLPLAASAQLGHAPAPRESAQQFTLELTALGLGPAGGVDASGDNCVVIRAQGPASVLGARAKLSSDDALGPGKLQLEAAAPGVATDTVTGALPLAMELRAFALPTHRDTATIAVHLGEGTLGAAVGKRVTLALWIQHEGAPIAFAVDRC